MFPGTVGHQYVQLRPNGTQGKRPLPMWRLYAGDEPFGDTSFKMLNVIRCADALGNRM